MELQWIEWKEHKVWYLPCMGIEEGIQINCELQSKGMLRARKEYAEDRLVKLCECLERRRG